MFHEIVGTRENALELEDFRQMDYYAVENYQLPIELMMENAGLQLANLIAYYAPKDAHIMIGVGNGNNGGGGLVAARRLKAWNYSVSLDLPTQITRELPKKQLARAIAFGVEIGGDKQPEVWVDAYLGFSQRLPLSNSFMQRIQEANDHPALKISLDIPTGYLGDLTVPYFMADKIVTLAAPKKILFDLDDSTELFVADIGIPSAVYKKLNIEMLEFDRHNLLRISRSAEPESMN